MFRQVGPRHHKTLCPAIEHICAWGIMEDSPLLRSGGRIVSALQNSSRLYTQGTIGQWFRVWVGYRIFQGVPGCRLGRRFPPDKLWYPGLYSPEFGKCFPASLSRAALMAVALLFGACLYSTSCKILKRTGRAWNQAHK